MNEIKIGDFLLLQYGNGTQVARVTGIGKRGALEIQRGYPAKFWLAEEGGPVGIRIGWSPSKLKADDSRIIGPLPDNDPRRRFPGFADAPGLLLTTA